MGETSNINCWEMQCEDPPKRGYVALMPALHLTALSIFELMRLKIAWTGCATKHATNGNYRFFFGGGVHRPTTDYAGLHG